MAKHTQTICRQIADELFECFDHFLGLALNRLNIPYWEIREYLAGKYLFEVTCKNIIHPTVAFHIEISQISGFYLKCNARLKLVNFLNIEPNEF